MNCSSIDSRSLMSFFSLAFEASKVDSISTCFRFNGDDGVVASAGVDGFVEETEGIEVDDNWDGESTRDLPVSCVTNRSKRLTLTERITDQEMVGGQFVSL